MIKLILEKIFEPQRTGEHRESRVAYTRDMLSDSEVPRGGIGGTGVA